MITEDSFFRKFPAVIDLKQRLVWQGAGWAIEMISLSYDRLKATASQIDVTSVTYPTSLAPVIFASCWSIIDQCHMLRQILKLARPEPDGLASAFIAKFEPVTSIRNAMDHLHQNIDNIANDKQPRSPLFGALSFCAVKYDDIDICNGDERTITRCKLVTLTAGTLTHPKHHFAAVNPAGRMLELPVGLFQFEAFKHRVNFSDMITDLRALVAHFDTVLKPDMDEQVREFARKSNLDENKLLNEHNGALMLVMSMEFRP